MRAALIFALLAQAAWGQSRWPGSRLARYFDARPGETKLSCDVSPVKPAMGFTFRLQAGYVAQVPLSQYAGAGHRWMVAVRVTPLGGGSPVYLSQRFRLPEIPKTKARAEVTGGYLLGEGRYDVSWVLMDETNRVCRKKWSMEARLGSHERNLNLAMAPGTVGEFSLGFHPPPPDAGAPGLNLTILLHAAPIVPGRAVLRPADRFMLIGTLSSLLEQLPARRIRLVVFNLDQQKELFRQEEFTGEALGQVWDSLNTLQLATVDYRILQNRGGDMGLLEGLAEDEYRAASPSDAVIFLGPRARPAWGRPREIAAKPQGQSPQFYYLQYGGGQVSFNRYTGAEIRAPSVAATLPDAISLMVSRLRGKTVSVRTPGDLARAIEQIGHR